MARIMHVITGLGTGGAEMMLSKLVSATHDRYSQAVMSLMDEGTAGARIASFGVPVYCLRMREGRPNPLSVFALRSLTRQFDPQLIVGWMYHGNLTATLAGVLAQKQTPVIWSIRQSLNDLSREHRLTAAVIRLNAFLSRRPAAIVYNSRTSAQQHEAFGYYGGQRVVIPNGTDCQAFRPDPQARSRIRREMGFDDDIVLVGLVARYHPMKDHAGFLRTAALVAGAHPSVRFVLIGRGIQDQPELLALAEELRIQDRLLLLGERADTPQLNAALDIACSSSWTEGFSNTIGEAMACGVPCVVTEVGDSGYLVADTGLTVPPRNPGAMAHAINQLVAAGPQERHKLGAAAQSRIEREFSLPQIVLQYEALYEKHLRRSR